MSCRFVAANKPRLTNRHNEDCADKYDNDSNGCQGCAPCPEPHCRVCGRTHAEATCAECLAETRSNLHDIGRMCNALPEEVEHRGVEGEAMMLLGPATNPERRGHLEASVLAGRLPWESIEVQHLKNCTNPKCTGCAHEVHPAYVLGSWESIWRDALEHDEPAESFDMATTIDYMDRTMSYMAGYPFASFEDFAKDLHRCTNHLEAVLHDGEQKDTGAPCMTCRVPLRRVWGLELKQDGWECPRCHQTSTDEQYRFAVAHLHREEATHLTDQEMQLRTGVRAGTIRVWAQRGEIERKRDQGRTVYSVEDVIARRGA